MYLVKVLIEHPIQKLDQTFDYLSDKEILSGIRVKISFARQYITGYVEDCIYTDKTKEQLEAESGFAYKYISEIIDEEPLLNEELSLLANKISQLTFAPKIACLQVMLPTQLKPSSSGGVGIRYQRCVQLINENAPVTSIKQKECVAWLKDKNVPMLLNEIPYSISIIKKLEEKGAIEILNLEVYRNPYEASGASNDLELTGDQQSVLNQIKEHRDSYNIGLLFGVTGSGKTEIYLQATRDIVAKGKTVIMLVPEISLTPMMVKRFKERFGNDVAVLHSKLSNGERYDEYRRISRGEVHIVIGARSAIFAPLKNIGLIIIDEEHDESYKQHVTPMYHTKDVAILRAKYHSCPIVLGSATPSMESYARATKGSYYLMELKSRIGDHGLPTVEVIDMGDEVRNGNYSIFSKSLRSKIQFTVNNGEQVILLLNRRGYSNFITCRDCGETVKCPHCDVSLTYHKDDNVLKCHYCDYTQPTVTVCPKCGSKAIKPIGYGTQKVEEEIYKQFDNTKVIRMDIDTISKKNGHRELLEAFEAKEGNILLGTQMIAKGLDFDNVTLVGVLNADISLNISDFRATERTFQLLTQVAGRSGRGAKKGSVVIQTYNPQHYSIQTSRQHNYLDFFRQEMEYRRLGYYPPFCNIVSLIITNKKEMELVQDVAKIKEFLSSSLNREYVILGPTKSLVYKVEDTYRMRILIKYKSNSPLMDVLRELSEHYSRHSKSKLAIDVNPYHQN